MVGILKKQIVTNTKYHVDFGSAQSVSSPKYLICAHQADTRLNAPNENLNTATFYHLNIRKKFVEIDGHWYQIGSVPKNYTEDD